MVRSPRPRLLSPDAAAGPGPTAGPGPGLESVAVFVRREPSRMARA